MGFPPSSKSHFPSMAGISITAEKTELGMEIKRKQRLILTVTRNTSIIQVLTDFLKCGSTHNLPEKWHKHFKKYKFLSITHNY